MRADKLLICDNNECREEFLLSAVKIEEAKVEVNGQLLTLVYFTCPKCNKIYRVVLKDERCEELAADIENMRNRIRRNRGSNNSETARMLGEMLQRKVERLRKHVDRLNEMFRGTFAFVVSENNQENKIIKYLP